MCQCNYVYMTGVANVGSGVHMFLFVSHCGSISLLMGLSALEDLCMNP